MKIPKPVRRLVAAAAITLAAALGASGCGSLGASGSTAAVTYAPAAYGVQARSQFDCYYIETTSEVTDLINAGLCPAGSIPTPMPLSWQETYWDYYQSPSYYDTYMPVSYRSTYTKVYVVKFSTKYKSQITTDASKGTYKSSTGKKVTGTSASKLKFTTSGTGSTGSSRSVHGGGSARGASSCSLAMTVIVDKGGSSTSHGGGSARSGTSTGSKTGSKTSSGSGAHGSC